MIYNRTAEDIAQAQEIFETKVKKFVALTEAEKTALERGRVTADALNRIEQKQAEIGQILNNWHYLDTAIANKRWSTEVFRQEDLKRLADNTAILREAFFLINDVQLPEARFFYEEFNKMEQILFELGELISNTKKSFKTSGTFSANQNILTLKGA